MGLDPKMSQNNVNCVFNFLLFFLNLSNKFPAGVRVRTIKYLYIDIGEVLTYLVTTALVGQPLSLPGLLKEICYVLGFLHVCQAKEWLDNRQRLKEHNDMLNP